jgi:hypothetical protein
MKNKYATQYALDTTIRKENTNNVNSKYKFTCTFAKLKLGGVFKSVSARAVQHSMGTFAAQLTCLRKVCGHVIVW